MATTPKKAAAAARTTNGAAPVARTFDLDAARVARAELSEPVTLTFGGREFSLPAELPLDFALHAEAGRLRESLEVLLDEDADAFFALRPSLPDIEALTDFVTTAYGLKPGE